MALAPGSRHRILTRSLPSLRLVAAIVVLLAGTLGCGRQSEIRSYTVPKQKIAKQGGAAAEATPPQIIDKRTIVLTVLAGDDAWFLKVDGPEEQVNKVADDVREFFKTVKVSSTDGKQLEWDAPAEWQAQGERPMRLATLQLPGGTEDQPPLEVAISHLPAGEEEQEYLLINVNRWLGQIALPPVKKEDLAEQLETIDVEGGKGWILDAVGKGPASGTDRGMMGFGMGRQATSSPPPMQSPVNPPPREEAAQPVEFDLPEGWRELPPRPMVLRVLELGEGETKVAIAVSAFPASAPQIADVLSNVNRWRGEVGLEEVTSEQLGELTEPVKISGTEGTVATMVDSDGAADSNGTLAAMVTKNDKVWFFKMTGTREGIEAHREAFIEWLDTVQIPSPDSKGGA